MKLGTCELTSPDEFLQSLGSVQKSPWSRDSSSSPLSHAEEDHVYRYHDEHSPSSVVGGIVRPSAALSVALLSSFPNKQKSSNSSSAAMTSALGSNLSELDRLLLELNAVQQSSPSFPTTGTLAALLLTISSVNMMFLVLAHVTVASTLIRCHIA